MSNTKNIAASTINQQSAIIGVIACYRIYAAIQTGGVSEIMNPVLLGDAITFVSAVTIFLRRTFTEQKPIKLKK